jgi:hypothetical protein
MLQRFDLVIHFEGINSCEIFGLYHADLDELTSSFKTIFKHSVIYCTIELNRDQNHMFLPRIAKINAWLSQTSSTLGRRQRHSHCIDEHSHLWSGYLSYHYLLTWDNLPHSQGSVLRNCYFQSPLQYREWTVVALSDSRRLINCVCVTLVNPFTSFQGILTVYPTVEICTSPQSFTEPRTIQHANWHTPKAGSHPILLKRMIPFEIRWTLST